MRICTISVLLNDVSKDFNDVVYDLGVVKKDLGQSTLREEGNAEKILWKKKSAIKSNSHSFILHFLNRSHHLNSLITHNSGILDHSQSFIPHFLNSRLHFFQCIFLRFKEIWHSLCKATLGNEANRK